MPSTMAEIATIRVGGPMLAKRDLHSKTKQKTLDDPVAWETLEPLIYDDGSEQFILMPNERFVTVLAYKTGRKVAHLIPKREHEEQHVLIESVCIANLPKKQADVNLALHENMTDDASDASDDASDGGDIPVSFIATEEQILLVGCQDGSLREFVLAVLTSTKPPPSNNPDCGIFQLSGPCFRPRRVFGTRDGLTIKHLTSPSDLNLVAGTLLFSVSEKPSAEQESAESKLITQCLHRIMLPAFDDARKRSSALLDLIRWATTTTPVRFDSFPFHAKPVRGFRNSLTAMYFAL
jgi:hypothetical protein